MPALAEPRVGAGGLALHTRHRLAGELGRFLTVLRQRRAELVLDDSGSIEVVHLDLDPVPSDGAR